MNPTVRTGTPPPDAPHVPVAIVGAGACGLVAAIIAARRGGGLRAAGARCPALGLHGAVVRLHPGGRHRDAARGRHPGQPGAVRRRHPGQGPWHGGGASGRGVFRAHRRGARQLQARHGIAFEVLDGFLYPGHSVRRMHAVPEKTGAALVAQLERAAAAAGADIVTQATVRELWVDGAGRITGVGYLRPDGRMEHLRCDALILACNGFGGNPAMVRELLPEMREALFAGHTGNDGSAIAWGRCAGRAAGRSGRLPGPWLLGDSAGRADHLGGDDGRRRAAQRARRTFPRRDRRAIRRPPSMCWRSPAAWPGTCSTVRSWHWRAAFPISAPPRRPAR